MSKIRLNTELRNKMFNKIKNVFETENTQEREAYLQARENVDTMYSRAFNLARDVVERAYPQDDVKVLKHFKQKYGSPCDVVAKDKCFYFAHTEVNDENEDEETKSHFDFGLYGNLNGSEYSHDEGRKFAYAYYRDELKQNGLMLIYLLNKRANKIIHLKLNTKRLTINFLVVVMVIMMTKLE
jgi:hypothetical protein